MSRSPREFYTRSVPAQFNDALERQALAKDDGARVYRSMQTVSASIAVRIGGHAPPEPVKDGFWLDIERGLMREVDAPGHPLLLTLTHDLASFSIVERESGDSLLGLVSGFAGATKPLHLTRERLTLLRELNGGIRFERTGSQPFVLRIDFGPEPAPETPPSCSLMLDHAVHAALRAGQLDLHDAFMGEQVRVAGDMRMALQLALAVLAPD